MLDKWFMSGVIYNNNLFWITEIGGNIMKMDLTSYNIEFVNLNNLDVNEDLSSSAMVYIDRNIIYTIVNGGKKLLILNCEDFSYRYLNLDGEMKYLNMYASVSKHKDELIIIPQLENNLYRINVVNGEIRRDKILQGNCEKNNGEMVQFFAKCDVIEGDCIYIFSNQTTDVIKYNKITEHKEYYVYPDCIGQATDVIKYNDEFYVLNLWGEVYKWNFYDGTYNKIALELGDIYDNYFSTIHISNDKLWLFPQKGKNIYIYDLKKSELICYDEYPKDFVYNAPEGMGKYTYKIYDKECCYFSMHAGNYIVTIEQGVAQFIEAKWPDEDDELKYLVDKGISQFDETIISLDRFIQYVEDKKENVEENEYGNGKKIWQQCKSL